MSGQLVVILGAGASADCCGTSSLRIKERTPPLVWDLFRDDFQDTLNKYRLAAAAAAQIRHLVRNSSFVLEQYIREQLLHGKDDARRRYRQLPLYFQDLFTTLSWTNGNGFTRQADNYDVLVNTALDELDEVVFVTLNYDRLLDNVLFARSRLHSMDAYIEPGRQWSLIKLHGSVNWGRKVTMKTQERLVHNLDLLTDHFDALGDEMELAEEIELRDDAVLREGKGLEFARYEQEEKTLYYPAVSVPIGSEDEISCPAPHQDFLRERLKAFDGVNVLVIGYSGNDREVLSFLRESGNELRRLQVVNLDIDPCNLAADQIRRAFGRGPSADIEPRGFSTFVAAGDLHAFIVGTGVNGFEIRAATRRSAGQSRGVTDDPGSEDRVTGRLDHFRRRASFSGLEDRYRGSLHLPDSP